MVQNLYTKQNRLLALKIIWGIWITSGKQVESPKSWNSMVYICRKNTFFQLKHYIQRIYLTLLSTTVKIHQIPYVIFETISHFYGTTRMHFFSSNITYLSQKYPIKAQIFRFSTARVKIHQLCHVIFQTNIEFFFKVWITLQCHER